MFNIAALEQIPVSSIRMCKVGSFLYSKIGIVELQYVLSHIVRISQKRGKWITKLTLNEFLENFDPAPVFIRSEGEILHYLYQLEKKGYIKTNGLSTLEVTDKFTELCSEYSVL